MSKPLIAARTVFGANTCSENCSVYRWISIAGAISLVVLSAGLGNAQQPVAEGQTAVAPNAERITREGVVVDFSATPASQVGEGLREGEYAHIEFKIASAENGEPLQGVYPGVWVDLVQTAEGERPGNSLDCRTRVGTYLQGLVGMRPMIDLNSYFLLVLNRDASISVIDPVVGVTGITSLYTNIPLKRPGADWAKTQDEKTLFVTMPRAGEVAVVDLDTFKVTKLVPGGDMPTRIVLQPDGRFLWVGNDVANGRPGGVTIIDAASLEVVGNVQTGTGHHEIAFSDDNRTAFVTNRESGTVSIIDIAALAKVRDIEAGVPIALAYSSLSQSAYVADGLSGEVAVIDARTRELVTRIQAKPGLGPLRFSADGRWGVVVNPEHDEVYVVDAATNELAHTIRIEAKPFQIGMSRAFAYIRSLESEQVTLINLQELARGGDVVLNRFSAGTYPPAQALDMSLADTMKTPAQEAAMIVVSPGDATVYYYMEGMNAPMGAFRNYGHAPRAVEIANRALKEVEPGLYSATIRLPAAGKFEVAFMNEAPRFFHCFTMAAETNPSLERRFKDVEVEYLTEERRVSAGETMTLKFRLIDPRTGDVRSDVPDVRVKYFRAPRFDLTELAATHVGVGIYEAELPLRRAGGYYIYVAAPSLKAGYDDLDYLTLLAVAGPTP
ncbi:MAG TPA: cytochrome D1 domain-containing protein [Gammaproteobacteria bacterium]|nr:cytochrome D1 domain-containing protein [Gammaproteobacteria bacterium]